jgi:outer membrane protein
MKVIFRALTTAAALTGALAAQTKVGVISIQQALLSTKDGQAAAQQLQTRFDPKRQDIAKKEGELQQLQAQFQKSQNTASEDQKTKLARDIDQRQRALQRDKEDAQGEFEQEKDKVLNEIGNRLMQVIDKFAKDNQYSLILDVSSQQTPVLYMASGLDITADVVKLYDANAPSTVAPSMPKPAPLTAPVKPTSAAPKPAATKP